MTILFTGFEPFGGDSINSSWEAVKRLPDEINGNRIVKCRLPVEYTGAVRVLTDKINAVKPGAVICTGQAAGRAGVTIERVAINIDDSTSPDNFGCIMTDVPIRIGAAPAYFATLPIKKMLKALKDAGLPAAISNSAGTFVCNHVMYSLIDTLAIKMYNVPSGFIHLPLIDEQAELHEGLPHMPVDELAKALAVCAGCLG